jgi:hypothetical protein
MQKKILLGQVGTRKLTFIRFFFLHHRRVYLQALQQLDARTQTQLVRSQSKNTAALAGGRTKLPAPVHHTRHRKNKQELLLDV